MNFFFSDYLFLFDWHVVILYCFEEFITIHVTFVWEEFKACIWQLFLNYWFIYVFVENFVTCIYINVFNFAICSLTIETLNIFLIFRMLWLKVKVIFF